MDVNLIAEARTIIAAPPSKVWKALTTREALKQYMFGSDVSSDWREGSEITWQGEFKGKKYEDKGVVLKAEPERELQYTHFSPLSGKPDVPENYHTVTVKLRGQGEGTEVSLSQDKNATEEARAESAKNWNTMLEGLKKYVEEGK